MSSDDDIARLRHRIATQLMRLEQLAVTRNRLLHAAAHPSPSLRQSLRANCTEAEALRRAARLARAQLVALES